MPLYPVRQSLSHRVATGTVQRRALTSAGVIVSL